MKQDIPNNFHVLHVAEETLRNQSVEAIKASETLLLHAELIEHTMSLLKFFIQVHESTSDDDRTVKLLGIRLFNGAASTWKLLLAGYHQTSAAQQRDLMETIVLLDYFRTDPSLIAEWRTSTDQIRRKKFSPSAVRKALDQRDGFKDSKRSTAYKMLCELAGHPTYLGFHMLTEKPGGDIYTGPFFDARSLKAGLEELSRLLAQAGGVFLNLFPQRPTDIAARLSYIEVQGRWAERFLGRPFDRFAIDALRGMIGIGD